MIVASSEDKQVGQQTIASNTINLKNLFVTNNCCVSDKGLVGQEEQLF